MKPTKEERDIGWAIADYFTTIDGRIATGHGLIELHAARAASTIDDPKIVASIEHTRVGSPNVAEYDVEIIVRRRTR